jgi:hypothetical protein
VTSAYRSWPAPARALAEAVDAGVSAAHAADAPAFASAVHDLARLDREQVLVVLGFLTRDLVERAFPDGLDSDDAAAVLTRCVDATTWYGRFETDALVRAFTDVLGVGDPDGQPGVAPDAVLAHGLFLVDDLLTQARERLAPRLDHALAELQREQTMEMP